MELKNSQAYIRSKLTKDTTLPVTLTEWKLFRAGEVANRKRRNLPRVRTPVFHSLTLISTFPQTRINKLQTEMNSRLKLTYWS